MAEGFFTDAAKKFCIDVTAMGAFSHSVMSSIDWIIVDAFTYWRTRNMRRLVTDPNLENGVKHRTRPKMSLPPLATVPLVSHSVKPRYPPVAGKTVTGFADSESLKAVQLTASCRSCSRFKEQGASTKRDPTIIAKSVWTAIW
jgi:hypothetical protein